MESLSFSPDARDRIRAAGATFTDEAPLTFQGIERAPNGPGVFVLVCQDENGGARFAWSEASHDVRARLRALTSEPEILQAELRGVLEQPERLRFRAAPAPDPERRARLADVLASEVRRTRPRTLLGFVC